MERPQRTGEELATKIHAAYTADPTTDDGLARERMAVFVKLEPVRDRNGCNWSAWANPPARHPDAMEIAILRVQLEYDLVQPFPGGSARALL